MFSQYEWIFFVTTEMAQVSREALNKLVLILAPRQQHNRTKAGCKMSLQSLTAQAGNVARVASISKAFYSLLQKTHCTCARDETTCWNVRQLQKSWLKITRQFVRSFPANDFLQQVFHLVDFKCVRIVNESSGEFSPDFIFSSFLRRLNFGAWSFSCFRRNQKDLDWKSFTVLDFHFI